ncbi:MAG: transporter transrane protein [Firmicutes bacterium]|nr:transporter transrane protein [Bacillota bacterium]
MNEEVIYPKYRWFVLFVLIVVTAVGCMTMIAPAPLVAEISKSVGVSLGETTALTMMSVMLATFFSAVLSGFLIDKIGFTRNWIIGLSIQIIVPILMYFYTYTANEVLLMRILQGIGMGPINTVIATVCAQWFKYEERTYVAAVQGFSVWLGISLGLIYTPTMFEATGSWHTALAFSGLPAFIALIFVLIVHYGPKPPAKPDSIGVKTTETGNFKLVLLSPAIFMAFLLLFLDQFYMQAFNDMAPGFYAADQPVGLGLGPMGAGSRLMWAGYASMIGGLVCPIVVEKIFKGKPRVPLFIVCTLSAVLVYVLRFLTPDSGSLLITLPAAALFCSAFVNPTVFGFIAKHYPENVVGRLGGFATSMGALGSMAGLAAGSTALHITGFYDTSMTILATVVFLGGLTVRFLKPPKTLQ